MKQRACDSIPALRAPLQAAQNGGSTAGVTLPPERTLSKDYDSGDESDADADATARSSVVSIDGGAATAPSASWLGDGQVEVAAGKSWEAKAKAAAAGDAADGDDAQPASFSISAAATGGAYDASFEAAQQAQQHAEVAVTFMPAAGSARGGWHDGLRRRTTSTPEEP